MYIKNRRDSDKFKAFGSCQAWCFTKSKVLKNRLHFIYYTLWASLKTKTVCESQWADHPN